MVRAADNEKARTRLLKVLDAIDDGDGLPVHNLQVFAGDVTDGTQSMVEKIRSVTTDRIDTIWHSAVTFKFHKRDLPEIEAINIQGSRNVIHTSLLLNGEDPHPRYMHVSTAYSSGRFQGKVPERIVESTPDYRGLYEWSKHEVELDVARFHQEHGVDVTVLRPAIIVGCEDTGSVTHSGYYQVIGTIYKIYLHRKRQFGADFDHTIPLRFEADPGMRLNLVPIDYVIDSMVALAKKEELRNSELKVFNLINEDAPIMRNILDATQESLGVTGLTIVDQSAFERDRMNSMEKLFARAISFQAPYIKEDVSFEMTRFRTLVTEAEVPVPVIDSAEMRRLNLEYFDLIRPELERELGIQAERLPSSSAAAR